MAALSMQIMFTAILICFYSAGILKFYALGDLPFWLAFCFSLVLPQYLFQHLSLFGRSNITPQSAGGVESRQSALYTIGNVKPKKDD